MTVRGIRIEFRRIMGNLRLRVSRAVHDVRKRTHPQNQSPTLRISASMRFRKGLVLSTVISMSFLLKLYPLFHLLVLRRYNDDIPLAELSCSTLPPTTSQLSLNQSIPKIIHQVYLTCNTSTLLAGTCAPQPVPEIWITPQTSCIDIHPDYEYKVCTFVALICMR